MSQKNATKPYVELPLMIDAHMHLPDRANTLNRLTPEERIEVDKVLGIKKCVALSYADNNPVDIGISTAGIASPEDTAEVAAKYPDHFTWFCNVYPDGTDKTYNRLEAYKKMGCKGMGEFISLFRFSDPLVQHLLGCLEDLELPFLFHMNPTGKGYGIVDDPGLPEFEECLAKFPKLKFIGHSQPFWFEISEYDYDNITVEERCAYPAGPVTPGRVPYLLRKYDNLYADLSADSAGNAIMRDPDYGIQFLTEFQDKLLFGTDMANTNFIYPLNFYLKSLVHQDKLSAEVFTKIGYLNAERLLGI